MTSEKYSHHAETARHTTRRSVIAGGVGLAAVTLPSALAASSTEPAPAAPTTTTTTAPLGSMTWTERTNPALTSGFVSVTYGGGAYVAVAALVGDGHRVIRSTDGINWTKYNVSVEGYNHNDWRSVTHGNGTFVAVSNNGSAAPRGHVMTSTDGITWTRVVAPVSNPWWSVAYGEPFGTPTFVATAVGGTGNRVMTSTDNGATWTTQGAPDRDWVSVTYGGGTFVAVATDGAAMTSTNGTSWTLRSTPSSIWRTVTYGNGTFVAVSDIPDGVSPLVMRSTDDGASWTSQTAANQYNWSAVTYGGGLFVAVARYGGSGSGFPDRVMTSPDGVSWTRQNTPVEAGWRAVTYGTPGGSGLFVAVGGGAIMTSPTGT